MRQNWHSIREYESLRAMIIAGTTTAAAKQLGISQSAVSRSIANLEARVGNALFIRSGGRLEPTAEALGLNDALDPIFTALASIDQREPLGSAKPLLRVGAPPTIAHRFLHLRMSSFMKLQPDYDVFFDVCDSDRLIRNVADELYDVAVADFTTRQPGVMQIPFRRSKLVCLVPANSPLSEKDVISPADLEGYPIVSSVKRHPLRSTVDQMFARAKVEPNVVAETATTVANLEFVRAGVGVGFVNPFPIAESIGEGVLIKPIDDDVEFRTCFLLPASQAQSAGARALMRHIRISTRNDQWSEAIT
ncbi:LysR family transcriptional regulator [Roseibium algae]|uniref:LysR family transcriptional regulator n=1 Tax=Roseibium algae TaxID=3123038 RepID=A0ABU8TFI6_9HYPH